MMIKVIPPGSYNFDEEATKLIKVASNGLQGSDLNSLIKRSSHELALKVKNMNFHKGEVPIHLIALGATEGTSINRNGDGFKEAALKKYHPTFKKYAKFFRNHRNGNDDPSYGIVKESYYNEAMKRVELIVALNGTKEAAERNKGQIADKEIEKLEKSADLGQSMSCRVNYDECSSCHNKAKHRDEYCTGTDEGGQCKHGGLKNRIGQVFEDGHVLHADNPHPKFFDISSVFRPADRISYVLGKVASHDRIIGGAELAESMNLTLPYRVLDEDDYDLNTLSQMKLAYTLSKLEKNYKPSNLDLATFKYPDIDFSKVASHSPINIFNSLTKNNILLSINDWLKIATNASEEKCAEAIKTISSHMPYIFIDLVNDANLSSYISSAPYESSMAITEGLNNWSTKLASTHSLSKKNISKRIWNSVINNHILPTNIKTASDNTYSKSLAKQYGIYQLGFLKELQQTSDFDLTCDLVIRQNHFSY